MVIFVWDGDSCPNRIGPNFTIYLPSTKYVLHFYILRNQASLGRAALELRTQFFKDQSSSPEIFILISNFRYFSWRNGPIAKPNVDWLELT
jgi:hypothetical protein